MFISTCASQICSKITLVSDYFKDKWREHGTKLTPNMVFRYRNRDWSYYWYSTDKNSYICLFFYLVCGGERVQTGCDVAPRSTKMKQEVLPRKEIATKNQNRSSSPSHFGEKMRQRRTPGHHETSWLPSPPLSYSSSLLIQTNDYIWLKLPWGCSNQSLTALTVRQDKCLFRILIQINLEGRESKEITQKKRVLSPWRWFSVSII